LRIVTGTSMVASNTSPSSGHGLCVLRNKESPNDVRGPRKIATDR
jgi:hypothetical protein